MLSYNFFLLFILILSSRRIKIRKIKSRNYAAFCLKIFNNKIPLLSIFFLI